MFIIRLCSKGHSTAKLRSEVRLYVYIWAQGHAPLMAPAQASVAFSPYTVSPPALASRAEVGLSFVVASSHVFTGERGGWGRVGVYRDHDIVCSELY